MRVMFTWLVALLTLQVHAGQSMVSTEYADAKGNQQRLEMRVMTPDSTSPDGKRPAVVILHHAGGWRDQTTAQYAKALNAAGFITLEPVLFNEKPLPSHIVVPMVFGALKYARNRPDVFPTKIGVMGLSMGAQQSIYAISEWATKTYGEGAQFASALALYPGCWIMRDYYKNDLGRFKNPNYPEDFLHRFIDVPLTILAAGKDDYDSRKANTCQQMVELVPDETQRTLTKVEVFKDATHGWDHGRTYSFQTPFANEGRGGTNTNVFDPAITQLSQEKAVQFFKATLLRNDKL